MEALLINKGFNYTDDNNFFEPRHFDLLETDDDHKVRLAENFNQFLLKVR